jgi:hypothetical protein
MFELNPLKIGGLSFFAVVQLNIRQVHYLVVAMLLTNARNVASARGHFLLIFLLHIESDE